MYRLIVYRVILLICLFSCLIEGCGMMMPVRVPPLLKMFVNQRSWNELRNKQLKQMQHNNLCNVNSQENPFVCNMKIRTLVTRHGVCTSTSEAAPVCMWKENTNERNTMDGRSSIGYDREHCIPENNVIVNSPRRLPHAYNHRRHDHPTGGLARLSGGRPHHRTIQEYLRAVNAQTNHVDTNNYNLAAEGPNVEIACSFNTTVVSVTEGHCKKLGHRSNSILPNFGCQHINGTLEIGHEDCRYLNIDG